MSETAPNSAFMKIVRNFDCHTKCLA